MAKSIIVIVQNRKQGKQMSTKAKKVYYFLLPLALFINLTSAGIEGVATYLLITNIRDRLDHINKVEVVLQNEAYTILIQDAALTGSASRFELTEGDTYWEQRYLDNIPALDDAIAKSQELSQTTRDLQIYDIIDSVNAILIAKEDESLIDPVGSGLSALYGQEYLSNKNIYNV